MSSILDEIIENTRKIVKRKKEEIPEQLLWRHARGMPLPRNFAEALSRAGNNNCPAVIAELKKASPSKGVIRKRFPVIELARELENAGASALSVLTEPDYFYGSLKNLRMVTDNVSIPVLCKDFIIDPYQIMDARAQGASAILLIVAALEKDQLEHLLEIARELQLDVLMETHKEEELDIAVKTGVDIIGVNSRDLSTFQTNVESTASLISQIPEGIVKVAESGIKTGEQIERFKKAEADAVLVGESLMNAKSPAKKLKELMREKG